MRTKSGFLSIALLVLLIATAAPLRSQNARPSPSEAEHTKRSLAVNLLRVINTAELDYKMKHGAYASKDALLASDWFKGREIAKIELLAKAPLSGAPEILPGWALRLNVTADGKAYDVLLEDTTDQSCGYAVVSDERGVIRQSKAIDCGI